MRGTTMTLQRQLFCATAVAFLFPLLNWHEALAEQMTSPDTAINDIYDSVLQREYAGPVVFPNHQVERKAQRSPSLRLRFGRRNDPDFAMLPNAQKRWWGDVNQKPIRSPSLRLRFGKRNNDIDALMNSIAMDENGAAQTDDYNEAAEYDGYERTVRKPQRLRWGRSAPFNGYNNELIENEDEAEVMQRQRAADLLNKLLVQDRLLKTLFELLKYDYPTSSINVANTLSSSEEEGAADDFQRETRKPGPLRLRWGRSTGGVGSGNVAADEVAHGKEPVAENAVKIAKTENEHAQDKN